MARFHPNHCRVIAEPALAEGEKWRPDVAAQRRIRMVRRQFEALRPAARPTAQPDGDELDLSSLVRSVADRKAGGPGSDRLYTSVRPSGARPLGRGAGGRLAVHRRLGRWPSRARRGEGSAAGAQPWPRRLPGRARDLHLHLAPTRPRACPHGQGLRRTAERSGGSAHPGVEARPLHPYGRGTPPCLETAGRSGPIIIACCSCCRTASPTTWTTTRAATPSRTPTWRSAKPGAPVSRCSA